MADVFLVDILSAPEDKGSTGISASSGPLPPPGRSSGGARQPGRAFVNNIPSAQGESGSGQRRTGSTGSTGSPGRGRGEERTNVRQAVDVRNKMAAVVRNVTRNAASQRHRVWPLTSSAGTRPQSSTSSLGLTVVGNTTPGGGGASAVTKAASGGDDETLAGSGNGSEEDQDPDNDY